MIREEETYEISYKLEIVVDLVVAVEFIEDGIEISGHFFALGHVEKQVDEFFTKQKKKQNFIFISRGKDLKLQIQMDVINLLSGMSKCMVLSMNMLVNL